MNHISNDGISLLVKHGIIEVICNAKKYL